MTPNRFRDLRSAIAHCLVAWSVLGLSAAPAEARVVRVVVDKRESPAYDGKSFGAAGPYERVTGRVFGELDPRDRRNAIINDIDLAPRNARGMVEYEATFTLWQPADPAKASGVLVYAVPNRGNRLLIPAFHLGGDPRRRVLLQPRRRHPVERLAGRRSRAGGGRDGRPVPVAKNRDGSTVTGPVLARFSDMPAGAKTLPLPTAHAPATLDTTQATLTRRASEDGAVVPLAPGGWAFADCRTAAFPGTPDPARISVKGGFDPAYLYQLVYTAKDPPVLGIGLAATRDVVSFFRHPGKDDGGTDNPVRAKVSHVLPLVEEEYRVATGPGQRAVVGDSMGGPHAPVIGLNHPELFAHVGAVRGNAHEATPASPLADPEGTNRAFKLIWPGRGTGAPAMAGRAGLGQGTHGRGRPPRVGRVGGVHARLPERADVPARPAARAVPGLTTRPARRTPRRSVDPLPLRGESRRRTG